MRLAAVELRTAGRPDDESFCRMDGDTSGCIRDLDGIVEQRGEKIRRAMRALDSCGWQEFPYSDAPHAKFPPAERRIGKEMPEAPPGSRV